MNHERQMRNYQNCQRAVPEQYRQPVRGFIGRSLIGALEDVDYVPGAHIRIWYNCQMEGYDSHHHSAIEIITCVENGYTVYSCDRTYVLNTNDILIIPPGLLHRLPGGKQGARFIFLIDPAPLEGFREVSALVPLFVTPMLISASGGGKLYTHIHDLLMHMISVYFENKSMWELKIYADLFSLYSAIGSNHFEDSNNILSTEGNGSTNYDKFTDLMKYLDAHYSEEITLETAADFVGFSKFHFTRLFKVYSGTTFHDVLRRKRILAAQRLLSTGASVTDVAFQTGFTSLASFGRCFKNQTGMTPSEYRAMRESFNGHISDFTTESTPVKE